MRRISLHVVALLAALALVPASASAASWVSQSVPEPGGALGSALNGVHCTGTTACTGVGRYDDSGGVQKGLAERWNGTSWSTQTIPFPASALSAELAGVYCTSGTACRAVGTYKDSGNVDRTFGVNWNGVSWAQDTTPNPAGSLGAYLSSIHCTASNACTAVGSYIDSGRVQQALVQRWNGSTWSTQTTPNPASHMGSDLAGISCTSASACTAVGTSLNASRQAQPLSMRWNGTSWALDTVPLPVSAVGGSFSGVSCTSGTHCTAVGYTYDNTNIPFSLTEAWNGTSWSAQTAANPAGALDAKLRGTSCISSAWCEAVGGFTNSSREERAFAEKWS